MDRFVAPQFIDVEDKIIGPITVRQFIFMVIGGAVVFLAYKFLDTGAFALITLIVSILVIVFGFVKINGRRFHEFVKSMIDTLRRPKTRVWYKYVPMSEVIEKEVDKGEAVKSDLALMKKKVKPRHLQELALIVDTGGKYEGS